MKLLLCKHCQDVVKITTEDKRFCLCKKTWGRTIGDGITVEVSDNEHTIVLGLSNPSLVQAIHNRPKKGLGSMFSAFVIPEECPTVRKG